MDNVRMVYYARNFNSILHRFDAFLFFQRPRSHSKAIFRNIRLLRGQIGTGQIAMSYFPESYFYQVQEYALESDNFQSYVR